MKFLFLHIFALMALTFPGFALQPKKGSLFVRVVDTGAGLCCVLCLPNEEFVIFDAGNYEPDAQAYTVKAVGELIKDHAPVELLVLSALVNHLTDRNCRTAGSARCLVSADCQPTYKGGQ